MNTLQKIKINFRQSTKVNTKAFVNDKNLELLLYQKCV